MMFRPRRSLLNRGMAVGVVVLSATVSGPVDAAPLPIVDDCLETAYVDRTPESGDRRLDWDFAFAGSTERCLKIRVGQSVTWTGNFSAHPLEQDQGDLPNPIASHDDTGIVTFPTPGVFGFRCNYHFEMRGAIQVVPALEPVSVPWGGLGAFLALATLLLATSVRRRIRPDPARSLLDRASPRLLVGSTGPGLMAGD